MLCTLEPRERLVPRIAGRDLGWGIFSRSDRVEAAAPDVSRSGAAESTPHLSQQPGPRSGDTEEGRPTWSEVDCSPYIYGADCPSV